MRKSEAQLPTGTHLARAQLGHGTRPLENDAGEVLDEVPSAYPSKRMKPLSNRAKEGRVNPKGIPYLYLSDDINTAIAETRPWIGQYVSVGIFKANRDLKLVHFTEKRKRHTIYLQSPPREEIDRIVWESVNQAFSEPVQPDDEVSDYVPTQIIAEYIKSMNYDGIIYRSKLAKGLNIALFDLASADIVSCQLYQIEGVSLRHSVVE